MKEFKKYYDSTGFEEMDFIDDPYKSMEDTWRACLSLILIKSRSKNIVEYIEEELM